MGIEMRTALALSVLLLSVLVTPASAKGCLEGAVVGGVAGHYAGHHGVIGAAAGCLIGRHQAKKRAHVQQDMRQSDPGRI
jgi:outer membrane lipoprotein SlyB